LFGSLLIEPTYLHSPISSAIFRQAPLTCSLQLALTRYLLTFA